MKTSPRASSTDMGAHTFAWPSCGGLLPFQVSLTGLLVLRGIGSKSHFGAPVNASNARTLPLGAFTRALSLMAEPIMTVLPTMAGG